MIDIVIAHYNEDLFWVKKIIHNEISNIYIYSKYDKKDEKFNNEYFENLNPKVILKKVPNVGREAETILRYCYEQYNNLNEGVIFLQGRPNDCRKKLEKGIFFNKPHHSSLNDLIKNLNQKKIKYSNFQIGGMSSIGFPCNFRINEWRGEKCQKSKYTYGDWFKRNIRNHNSRMTKWYPLAQFGISKQLILSNKINYYKYLLDDNELNQKHPELAHYYERAWFYLFNCESKSKEDMVLFI